MFTVTCVAYVLSQVTITTFNRVITSFTVPIFASSQSVAMSTVLISCDIKSPQIAIVLCSFGQYGYRSFLVCCDSISGSCVLAIGVSC